VRYTERGAAVAIALIALASACAPNPSPTAPTPTVAVTATPAATASSEVEARLRRLKAELAITPHFCSLESRPCRTEKRAAIDRGIEALLARCADRSRRPFERCLAGELPAVLRELPSPSPSP
jgi:hypothetical protein